MAKSKTKPRGFASQQSIFEGDPELDDAPESRQPTPEELNHFWNNVERYISPSMDPEARVHMMRQAYKNWEIRKPKNIKPRKLEHGWLLSYLVTFDRVLWRRWAYYFACCQERGYLPMDTIPQISFEPSPHNSKVTRMVEACLNAIPEHGDYRGWGSWDNFNYFFDWLLYGFGHPGYDTLPEETRGTKGASMRLYQIFDLAPLMLYPQDYFGYLLADNRHGRHRGFFPTPMNVCTMMAKMLYADAFHDINLGYWQDFATLKFFNYRDLRAFDLTDEIERLSIAEGILYDELEVLELYTFAAAAFTGELQKILLGQAFECKTWAMQKLCLDLLYGRKYPYDRGTQMKYMLKDLIDYIPAYLTQRGMLRLIVGSDIPYTSLRFLTGVFSASIACLHEVPDILSDLETLAKVQGQLKSVIDPAVGTGRMLLASSNYSLMLAGVDIDQTVLKATLINGYLYAPWIARPVWWLWKPGLGMMKGDFLDVNAKVNMASFPSLNAEEMRHWINHIAKAMNANIPDDADQEIEVDEEATQKSAPLATLRTKAKSEPKPKVQDSTDKAQVDLFSAIGELTPTVDPDEEILAIARATQAAEQPSILDLL